MKKTAKGVVCLMNPHPFKIVSKSQSAMDIDKQNALDEILQQEPVNACAVLVNGQIEFEYAKDKHQIEKLHTVNSITKSIISASLGLALQHEYITDLQTPLIDFFPDRELGDSFKQLTLRDLLMMNSGIDWKGNKPLVQSENWFNYILSRPVTEDIGPKMTYVCGNSHLLSAVIQKSSGINTAEFTDRYLFQPLHIRSYKWRADPQGVSTGGFGIEMTVYDLLKFGYLYLRNGVWEGVQLIDPNWIKESTVDRLPTDMGNQRYAYHWWVNPETKRLSSFYYAAGSGGQYIFIVPEKQIVCVFTCEYSRKEGVKPFTFFTRYILGAFDH